MVKVKVLEDFYDRENDMKLRKKDQNMDVSEERASKLIGLGFAKILEDGKEQVEEKKPAKRGSKK